MTTRPPGQSASKKILLVDDDEDSCEALAYLLGLPGHRVVTAYTVAEGLRMAQARGFDLIILDNWFKVGGGIELCRRIREFDADTPILFYSAAAYEMDIREGLGAGADAYIVKPDFGELQRAVNRMLSAGRQ
ncbi:MAG TPA: response regulator [Blastocatellia bacterium]|nr:response regulator [Blastocatellia bacterium]